MSLGPMFAAFGTLRAVHEMRWYLADAATRDLPDDLGVEVDRAAGRLAALAASDADDLADLDVGELRGEVGDLLGRVSSVVRDHLGGRDLRGHDLVGRGFRDQSLRGADLRGALLIGADLRGADLRCGRPARRGPPRCRPAGRRPHRRAVRHRTAADRRPR